MTDLPTANALLTKHDSGIPGITVKQRQTMANAIAKLDDGMSAGLKRGEWVLAGDIWEFEPEMHAYLSSLGYDTKEMEYAGQWGRDSTMRVEIRIRPTGVPMLTNVVEKKHVPGAPPAKRRRIE